MLRFRYSGWLVPDVPATVDFYARAFGLALRYMHPSQGYAELATGDTLLAFISEEFERKAALLGKAKVRTNRVEDEPIAALVAFVTEDMDGDWQRALSAGATIVKEPEAKPWGQTAGYLSDCNGVIVELCTRSPRG